MAQMFDRWNDHLEERLGARRSPRPQLPIIPLAVDVEAISQSACSAEGRLSLEEPACHWGG